MDCLLLLIMMSLGESEALIRINFTLGTFHQPKSSLLTSAETKKYVSDSILYVLRWILFQNCPQ